MSLTLYIHPLASFCHKVLIALYENGTPFRAETVDFGDPGAAAAHVERWPVGKIPVLFDARTERVIAEAQPFFPMFPYRDVMPARFLADQP